MTYKVPVRDTRVQSLDTTSLYCADHMATLIANLLEEEVSIWQTVIYNRTWRLYLRTQANETRLN